jgi:hypothetical protein
MQVVSVDPAVSEALPAAAAGRPQHCLGAAPVSAQELREWAARLPRNEGIVIEEISAITEAPASGIALNVSGFLARAYARHLTGLGERTFCLAPEPLSRAAAAGGKVTELTGTPCTPTGGALSAFLAIDPAAPDGASCLDGQVRLPDVGFRLASGPVCGGE